MATTLGFGIIPSVHGGRGLVIAYGTAAAIGDAGSFAINLQRAGSKVLRNVLAPQVTVNNRLSGSQLVVEASGSSNGYIAINLWANGSSTAGNIPTAGGTADLNFLVIGGGGSI
ncbi:MAG: hypothetical protein Q7R52_02775 [archaeon]|nr:hypothetical protein [archaeon]